MKTTRLASLTVGGALFAIIGAAEHNCSGIGRGMEVLLSQPSNDSHAVEAAGGGLMKDVEQGERLVPDAAVEGDAAVLERATANAANDVSGQLGIARAAFAHDPSAFDRTVPYGEEYPFLRVKTAVRFESTLVSSARQQLGKTLAAPFDVRDLHIITYALSENPATSVRAATAFKKLIPARYIDDVGPLARARTLSSAGLNNAERETLLEPYRGKTLIIVGHVPVGETHFMIHTPSGVQPIDLKGWFEAARTMEVNIIAIGCNSDRFAPFGTAGSVNSIDVAVRLRNLVRQNPRTIAKFLGKLSGPDLILVINPLEASLYDNALEIFTRRGRELVGRLGLSIRRTVIEEGPRLARLMPPPDYSKCFKAANSGAFNSCTASVRKTSDRTESRAIDQEAREYRAERLVEAPQELLQKENELDTKLGPWIALYLAYTLALVCSSALTAYGMFVARTEDFQERSQWKYAFDPNTVRLAVRERRWLTSMLDGAPGTSAFIFGPFVFGLLLYVPSLVFTRDSTIPATELTVVVWCCALIFAVGHLWNALTRRQFPALACGVALLSWCWAAYCLAMAYPDVASAASSVNDARAEIADLHSSAPDAAWRTKPAEDREMMENILRDTNSSSQ